MNHHCSDDQAKRNLEITRKKHRRQEAIQKYHKARSRETIIEAFNNAKKRYTFFGSLANRAVIKNI